MTPSRPKVSPCPMRALIFQPSPELTFRPDTPSLPWLRPELRVAVMISPSFWHLEAPLSSSFLFSKVPECCICVFEGRVPLPASHTRSWEPSDPTRNCPVGEPHSTVLCAVALTIPCQGLSGKTGIRPATSSCSPGAVL